MTVPNRFVGLHAHSGFSTYDGLSLPQKHIDFVLSNGMNAWALTDHGHANGHAHAFGKAVELVGKGIDFKFIPGVEFYFHPDLKQWRRDIDAAREKRRTGGDVITGDDDAQSTVENEEETKQTKWFDPVKRRHHLVVLAKSKRGLENLYTLVTRGYDEGLYRFPRIDFEMLKTHSEGLVVSTACIGGPIAYEVMKQYSDVSWDDMLPNVGTRETFDDTQRQLDEVIGRFVECVGRENFFLELQFNRLGVQHLVNQHIIAASRRSDIKLIATADSHYPGPTLWKDRELYKKLGWLNYDKYEPGMLPTSTDELKAELYPKNAQQMWDAYKDSVTHFSDCVSDWSFYNDDEISAAIERSYDVAHDMCDAATPDSSHLFSMHVVPDKHDGTGKQDPFNALVTAVKEGLMWRGLADKSEYVARAREELEVIKEKHFELYFLTMARVMKIAADNMTVGPGRGCFVAETNVLMFDRTSKHIIDIEVDDVVIDASGNAGFVTDLHAYDVDEELIELSFDDGHIVSCTCDHEFMTHRGWVRAIDITEQDVIVDVR
jgi:DNA polymerase III alpha subunit